RVSCENGGSMSMTEDQQTLLDGEPAAIEGPLRSRVTLSIAPLKEATEVIVKNHYLHRGRTMAQIAYWIELDGDRCGVLLYSYPRMSVKFHGYGPMQLVELARMWLDP